MKRQLSSVSDLLEAIKMEYDPMIFRGQNKRWPLLPKIARRNKLPIDYENWVTLEDDILTRFTKDVSLLLSKEPKNKLDWLVLGLQKPDGLTTFGRSAVKNHNLQFNSHLRQGIGGQLFSA